MEAEYSSKLNSKLLIFERNSKEWEWSDLIGWLSGLKQLIDRYSVVVPIDQIYILSKRLSQCLYPSLPHGLHSKTLEIYYSLLSTSTISQISILSTGLFPHFQFCAPQNKPQFLDLINERYITRFEKFHFILQGLFACLLSGANDTPDTFIKVNEILDNCANQNKQITHNVLWWFILKSERHRLAGLMYMQKRIDKKIGKYRIINALLESLADNSVMIRRSSLDLIRNSYPLAIKNKKSMIILMQGALKLIRSKDHTLLRRIWEWVFPDEYDESQIQIVSEILRPAVSYIFWENHFDIILGHDPDEAKLLSIKIAETLSENENIGDLILSQIAIDIVRHTVNDELFIIKGKNDQRIKQIFSGKQSRIFWKAFEESMNELLKANEKETLFILKFAINHFEFSYDSFPIIFSQLFSMLPLLTNLELALEILIWITNNIELYELEVSESIIIYKSLLKGSDTELLSKFTVLFGLLLNKGIDVPKVSKLLKKYTKKNFLPGISLILKLNTEMSSNLLIQLWDYISTDYHIRACELLTTACTVSKQEWDHSTILLILNSDISIQEKYMRKFISYWAFMEKNYNIELSWIVRNTKIVFIMIDQLGSENPITKHLAKEWLSTAQSTIQHVLDPILKVMLHKSTVREINSEGFYFYNQEFDYKRVEGSIIKIIFVISNGGKSIIQQIKQTNISHYSMHKCMKHSIQATSYLSLLITIMTLYIQTHSTYEIIQGSSTELLCMLVKDLPQALVTSTLNNCSEAIFKILQKDSKVESYFLKVLHNLFTNKVTFCYQSTFADVLILGLRNEKKKMRLNWMKFINLTLPSILNSIAVPELTNYLHSLFISYYDIIIRFLDFSLIPGMSVLIHCALDINNKKQTSLIHSEVKAMIKKQIDKILTICLKFYENSNNQHIADINMLITPIASTFQVEFIEGLLELWKENTVNNPKVHELEIIIKMTPTFNISPEMIFDIIYNLLQKFNKDSHDELISASFIQNILNVLENFKIPISGAVLWNRTLSLLKHFSSSNYKELMIIQINIICTLSRKIVIDQRSLKDLQEIVKFISLQCAEMLKWNTLAVDVCYYSLETFSETSCNKMVKTLIERGGFLFDIVWNKDQEKKKIEIIIGLLNNLLIEIPNCEEGAELVGKLIEIFSKTSNPKITEGIKPCLLEFYKNHLFTILKRYPKSIKSWENIINRIATKYYTEQTSLLSDLMYHYEPSFWYRTETILSLLYSSSSLMCFIIFSSPKSTYSNGLAGIIIKIKEILKFNNLDLSLFRVLCLLIKVLLLRLKKKEFTLIWNVVLSDLHILFLKYFKECDLIGTFEVLKFLDFMLATGFDNSNFICFYLFDVPEIELFTEESNNFKPAVANNFLSGYTAHPSKTIRRNMIIHTQNQRKILLANQKPENLDDLDRFVKILIQFCTFYTSEIVDTDWENVEMNIESDIACLNQYK